MNGEITPQTPQTHLSRDGQYYYSTNDSMKTSLLTLLVQMS